MSSFFSYLLVFFIPLIHSSFLNHFGFSFDSLVFGNFEFSKVLFFDIISSTIILSFFIEKFIKKESIIVPYKKTIFFIIIIFLTSSFLSFSSQNSIFGNSLKGHGLLMYLNLIGIIIIFSNFKEKIIKNILKFFIVGSIISIMIGIKEYFLPGLLYKDGIDRLIGTFGNNHFLALNSLLILVFLLYKNKKTKIKNNKKYFLNIILIVFFILSIILTKSFIAIFITFNICFYYIFGKKSLIISLFISFVSIIIIFFYFPEKIHSFLSRFFIWENTLKIVFSQIKILFIGNGFETLDLVFNKEKNHYLYIYENYGFTADRSHNLFIDFLFFNGFLGFFISIYLFKKSIKNFGENIGNQIFSIFFIFCFFGFPSIINYIFLTIIFALFIEKKDILKIEVNKKILILISIFSFLCIYFFSNFYISEIYYKLGSINNAYKYFKSNNLIILEEKNLLNYYKDIPEMYFKNQINNGVEIDKNCDSLTTKYKITENFFFCGEIFEKKGELKKSLEFYNLGLSLLPDLWNKNCVYYKNIIIKKTITGNRFFSEKYNPIKKVLEKTGKKQISK